MNAISTFKKGLPGSVALNFSPSAGAWCADSCPFKGSGCYAQNYERFRLSLRRGLQVRIEAPQRYVDACTSQVNAQVLRDAPWVRLSAFGTVPPPAVLEASAELKASYERLAATLDPAKTHLPVESLGKALYYRTLGFFPRLSLGSFVDPTKVAEQVSAFRDIGEDLPLSVVSAEPTRGPTTGSGAKPENHGWTKRSITRARQLRRALSALLPGRSVKVCPAIAGKAKCGACTLCAKGGADLVIYPEHS